MPAISKSGPSLFLGIELATDQFRASIVDESLELVGVECVDFDTELSEYQTQGGIFTTPGDAYTTPVEMWIKGLDILFGKLRRNYDLSKIKSIGGSAQHALVWWKNTSISSLAALDPHLPLHAHFPAHSFSLPNTPTAQDTSAHTHALAMEALLGGPDSMARRVGTAASSSLVAAQLLRVRESWHQDVWARTGRVQLASAFVGSLVTGKWLPMSEAEACATGIWVHAANSSSIGSIGSSGSSVGVGVGGGLGVGAHGHWDEGVLDVIAGNREEGRRVRGWLGEVDVSGGSRRAGNVSRYLVERYGFDPETIVTPFTSDSLSTYLSLCPSPNDAVLSFGPMDMLMTPAQHYNPTRLYNLYPHPAQDPSEKRRYIAVLSSRNADVPRALVRDMYTKSWSAFDRLVAVVPPGGSIGLDDKLFSFWHLQADSYPFSHVKGIFRFETGIKVNEFRDLRANPRCLLESQLLSFRTKWSRMIASGLLGAPGPRRSVTPNQYAHRASPGLQQPPQQQSSSQPQQQQQQQQSQQPPPLSNALGLSFDPYDYAPLPTRVITTGAAANFPSVSGLVGDIFHATVFVPQTQLDSAQRVPHRNAPAPGFASRATLGAAYVARWVWGKERGAGGLGAYEDEVRRLFGKRWIATGGVPLRTNTNAPPGGSSSGGGGGGSGLHPGTAPGSGANSGSSTPYGTRSALGNVLVEEEEEDEGEQLQQQYQHQHQQQYQQQLHRGNIGGGNGGSSTNNGLGLNIGVGHSGFPNDPSGSGSGSGRLRTHTASTADSILSNGATPSTAFTTPDLHIGAGIHQYNNGSHNPTNFNNNNSTGTGTGSANNPSTPTTPTPLTPVAPLPTGDAEAQLGLAKVADPDVDSFLTYAAIVPEYCRLETMVIKGLV